MSERGASPRTAQADARHECAPGDWQEDYYGWRCRACAAFIPFGSEPWMPDDYNPATDLCPHGHGPADYCEVCDPDEDDELSNYDANDGTEGSR